MTWDDIDLRRARGDLVAIGGTLSPDTLLAAYRAGAFPWPDPSRPRLLPWFSPDPRAVIPVGGLHLPRSLRARIRHCDWATTVDVAFDQVVANCADRRQTWITPRMRGAYAGLHRAGHAHSLEVWAGERLVGGLYGVLVGGVFSGESMFHREPDAAKVALVDLDARLASAGALIVDTQQETEHLRRLGQRLISRTHFLDLLDRLRDLPVRLDETRMPADRLLT